MCWKHFAAGTYSFYFRRHFERMPTIARNIEKQVAPENWSHAKEKKVFTKIKKNNEQKKLKGTETKT